MSLRAVLEQKVSKTSDQIDREREKDGGERDGGERGCRSGELCWNRR